MKQKVHFVPARLLDPTNPIEIAIIGAGGTGSQVLMCIARMNHALNELGHAGFSVSLVDPDKVSASNLGRQLFAESEIDLHKSVALINRVNRFFGTNWKAQTVLFQNTNIQADIYITCLDNVKGRVDMEGVFRNRGSRHHSHYRVMDSYWMDFGNSKTSGQVLLSTIGKLEQPKSKKYAPVDYLPTITEEFGLEALVDSEKTDDTPSCSLAEALEKQDLFINSTLAQMGCSLLWNLFRNGIIANRGFYLNLEHFRSQAIPV